MSGSSPMSSSGDSRSEKPPGSMASDSPPPTTPSATPGGTPPASEPSGGERQILRCPRCREDTIAVVAGELANCLWCGSSFQVNRGNSAKLTKNGIDRLPAPKRSSAARMLTQDPKPARRVRDPQSGFEKVLWEAKCRICGAPGVFYPDSDAYLYTKLTRHHLVPKSVGGDDVDDNQVPLCGDGTTGCHGDVEARMPGVRSQLRGKLRSPEIDYIVAKKSREWLDRHYPVK